MSTAPTLESHSTPNGSSASASNTYNTPAVGSLGVLDSLFHMESDESGYSSDERRVITPSQFADEKLKEVVDLLHEVPTAYRRLFNDGNRSIAYYSHLSTYWEAMTRLFTVEISKTAMQLNTMRSVFRLPPEILLLIFKASLQKCSITSHQKQLHVLRSVSVVWRRLIDSTRSLWCRLTSSDTISTFRRGLKNSGDAPLDILMDFHDRTSEKMEPLVSLQAHRLKRLQLLHVPSEEDISVLRADSLPKLEELSISSSPQLSLDDGWGTFSLEARFQLKRLTINETPVWPAPAMMLNLTTLFVSECDLSRILVTPSMLVERLKLCKRLQKLDLWDLQWDQQDEASSTGAAERIELPELSQISITYVPFNLVSHFVGSISTPCCKEFDATTLVPVDGHDEGNLLNENLGQFADGWIYDVDPVKVKISIRRISPGTVKVSFQFKPEDRSYEGSFSVEVRVAEPLEALEWFKEAFRDCDGSGRLCVHIMTDGTLDFGDDSICNFLHTLPCQINDITLTRSAPSNPFVYRIGQFQPRNITGPTWVEWQFPLLWNLNIKSTQFDENLLVDMLKTRYPRPWLEQTKTANGTIEACALLSIRVPHMSQERLDMMEELGISVALN